MRCIECGLDVVTNYRKIAVCSSCVPFEQEYRSLRARLAELEAELARRPSLAWAAGVPRQEGVYLVRNIGDGDQRNWWCEYWPDGWEDDRREYAGPLPAPVDAGKEVAGG